MLGADHDGGEAVAIWDQAVGLLRGPHVCCIIGTTKHNAQVMTSLLTTNTREHMSMVTSGCPTLIDRAYAISRSLRPSVRHLYRVAEVAYRKRSTLKQNGTLVPAPFVSRR